MACQFDGSGGDSIDITGGLPSLTTSYSMCGWAKREGDQDALTYIGGISAENNLNQHVIGYDTDGTTLSLFRVLIGTQTNNFSTSYAQDVWFFWGMTCQGTGASDLIGYAGRVTDATLQSVTGSGSNYTFAEAHYGARRDGATPFDGSVAALKMWDAVLTQAEFERERWSILPVRLANLTWFNPGMNATDVTDDWKGLATVSTAGTVTSTQDMPAVSWGVSPMLVGSPTAVPPSVIFPPNSLALTGVGR